MSGSGDTWPVEKLGSLIRKAQGKFDQSEGVVARYVGAQQLHEGARLPVTEWGSTADSDFPPTFKHTFSEGDVLIHSRNPRKVAIAPFDAVTGEKLFVLRPSNHRLREDFLYHTLLSDDFQRFADLQSFGSTNRFLNWFALIEYELTLPPVSRQAEIAAVLDVAQSSYRAAVGVVEALGTFRSAIWSEHQASLGDCTVVALGDVVEVKQGQVDPTDPVFQSMIHIAPDDIEAGTGELLTQTTAAEDGIVSGKYEFSADDVLYSKIRPNLRKVVHPGFHGICSADIYPIRSLEGIERDYLHAMLLSPTFTRYSVARSMRSGIPKINRSELLRYKFALPSLVEQSLFLDEYRAVRGLMRDAVAHVQATEGIWKTASAEVLCKADSGRGDSG